MRREPEYFGDQELVLVHVARRLAEALAVEKVLDAAAVDYAVEAAPYTSGILFFAHRIGAYFYVAPDSEATARALILERGLKPYKHP